jgi:hypothetical protein
MTANTSPMIALITKIRSGFIFLLINFHEEPLYIIKLDASSREAGQDSGDNHELNI